MQGILQIRMRTCGAVMECLGRRVNAGEQVARHSSPSQLDTCLITFNGP